MSMVISQSTRCLLRSHLYNIITTDTRVFVLLASSITNVNIVFYIMYLMMDLNQQLLLLVALFHDLTAGK